MNIEQKVNDWADAVTLRNSGNSALWTARFLIEGYWPTVGAVEDLTAIGGTIEADGLNQYVLTFPASKSREAVEMVAEQGGWLCERQTIAPTDR